MLHECERHRRHGRIEQRGEAASLTHENARRLDWSNRRALQDLRLWRESLEHAEHDGADKGDCQVRGNDTQSAD